MMMVLLVNENIHASLYDGRLFSAKTRTLGVSKGKDQVENITSAN